MIWPFRKKKYKVCERCGVHFEAISYSDPRWENLCETHREPVRDRAHRKDSVMGWASANFERLYLMMEKERNERDSRMEEIQAMYRQEQQDAIMRNLKNDTP